jgi:hypothetical protein
VSVKGEGNKQILEKIVMTEVIIELANVIDDQDNPKTTLREG